MSDRGLGGRCLCGAVAYVCPAPTSSGALCHCESCRRASGAQVVGLFTVPKAQVRFTNNKPTEYRSSPDVLRGSCDRCETSLTYWHEGWPDDLSLTIGSLHDPGRIAPTDHTGTADAPWWDIPKDGLPQSLSVRPD